MGRAVDKPVRRRLTRMSQLIAERRICALCGRAFALVKCEWAGLILTLPRAWAQPCHASGQPEVVERRTDACSARAGEILCG